MCGISGKLYFTSEKRVTKEEIFRMNDRIKHRGPDSEGLYINQAGSVGLGHRRLSIIDLSVAGDQPMSNENGSVWLVFNGEIYNFIDLKIDLEKKGHKFKSHTDGEVIIHLWEEYQEGCLEYLRGMFAFAIWDERQQKLFLARDRVGKKPLKYYLGSDCLIFTSELKAILNVLPQKPEVDVTSLPHFLSFNHVATPATGFKNIYKLPAAHYAVWHNGRLVIKRYWKLNFDKKIDLDYQEACYKIVELLQEAVDCRLVADVPLGIFLSGGIDSAVVTYLASRRMSNIKTFTIGFSQKKFDERFLAEKVARLFGTNHNELEIKPDAVSMLSRLVYHYEEPYADSSALATFYLAQFTKKLVTVALNGDGGDEAFGGYKRFLYWNLFHNFRKDFYNTIAQYFYFNDKHNYLYTKDFLNYINQRPIGVGRLNNMDEVLALSYETFLPNGLLAKVDIATMAHGLEARSPFLDHLLLEFVAKLPSSWKVRGFNTKRILKDVFKSVIPAEIMKGKRGFELPVDDWFRNELYNWASEILLDKRSLERGYFRKQGLERILNEHKSGKKKHGQRIWTLLCLEFWHRNFFENYG